MKGLIGEWEEFIVDVELDRKPVEVEVDEADGLDEKLQCLQALYIFINLQIRENLTECC